MNTSAKRSRLEQCENCDTMLQGPHCHACGQSAINPMRHATHAVEEFFEAIWHLDGRIFRTLRDLLIPGRSALHYLAGQRVRYIAPLRLFVVLSLFTFFVAQLVMDVENPETTQRDRSKLVDVSVRWEWEVTALKTAGTIAEVEQIRSVELRKIDKTREHLVAMIPIARRHLDLSTEEVNRAADRRIGQLGAQLGLRRQQIEALVRRTHTLENAATLSDIERLRSARIEPLRRTLASVPIGDTAARNRLLGQIRLINLAAGCRAAQLQTMHALISESPLRRHASRDGAVYGGSSCGGMLTFTGQPWDAETNPLLLGGAPVFVNRWLNEQIGYGQDNLTRMQKEPELYVRAMLGAAPTALFLLVPVFALLLKLAYLRSGWLYLEHLVVALYSHAFLVLAMLAFLLLIVLDGAITPHWTAFGWITGTLQLLVWLWLPAYLWITQKRVYGNGWPSTSVRYLVIGTFYFALLGIAAAIIALVSIVWR